jgi:hypothetical protein
MEEAAGRPGEARALRVGSNEPSVVGASIAKPTVYEESIHVHDFRIAYAGDMAELGPRRLRRAIFLLGLGLITTPFIHWRWIRPARRLKVAILDKTAADVGRREHRSLMWILDHWKIHRSDGGRYLAERDYAGFFPGEQGAFHIDPNLKAYEGADLIYVADTYGVYTEEWYRTYSGERSAKIYGGLERDEFRAIQSGLHPGSTLVMEFNSFASPTSKPIRHACESLLGVTWTGWIARHFDDLREGGEVPPWAIRNYVTQYHRPYLFRGPGYVFVGEDDRVVFLVDGPDAVGHGVRVIPQWEGIQQVGWRWSAPYHYWFDLVAERPGTQVLARFQFPMTAQGKSTLQAEGIPMDTPAITYRMEGAIARYYLSEDAADTAQHLRFFEASGYPTFRAWTVREQWQDDRAFFWRIYVPFMDRVLKGSLGANPPQDAHGPAPNP